MDYFTGYAVYSLLTGSDSSGKSDGPKRPNSKFDDFIGISLFILIVICGSILLPLAVSYLVVEGIDIIISIGLLKKLVIPLAVFIVIDRTLFAAKARKLEKDVRDLAATPLFRGRRNEHAMLRTTSDTDRYCRMLNLDIEKEKQKSKLAIEKFYSKAKK